MRAPLFTVAVALLATGCQIPEATPRAMAKAATSAPHQDIVIHDAERTRDIPMRLYGFPGLPSARLAILSHGYGGGMGDYGFIADHLVAQGYAVASVQNKIAGDPPLDFDGPAIVKRRPTWDRGVADLETAISALKARFPGLDTRKITLIGHSNGGDIVMWLTRRHPDRMAAAISLDHLRVPLPRTRDPRICSLRANDTTADPGVLPSREEVASNDMMIVDLAVEHNVMADAADADARTAILAAIDVCLGR